MVFVGRAFLSSFNALSKRPTIAVIGCGPAGIFFI